MIIKGAKAGRGKAHRPHISKDTVASTSTAKILYGLSEGEVYGLADGAKSIRLEGTPLVDGDGNTNFDDVAWDFRTGTNEQEYIKGFPDVNNETSVNVELKSDTPWVQAINNTQLSAVRVRLKWGRLAKTKDNSDVVGYKIDYAIDLKVDGSTYQTVQTHTINDKASAGYERSHRIDLPNAKTGWQIRVRRLTENSDSDLIQDKMYIDAFSEVIDVKLRYPNTALLGLQYDAETFQNVAKLSVRLKGKIINVPSNYDAESREYIGLWDGTFKQAYTNNPAWIYYDLCTEKRYGLGDRLDASMIDKWSIYQLGRYCDEMVDDGNGGKEPRFACNVYLQKQAAAYTVLSNMAGIFRAMSYWNGEQVIIDADVPQDPVYTFSRANVIEGNFEYIGTRQRDRHTVAKVAWDNPNNDYKTEYEFIRDEKAIAKFGVKVVDISAIGCTSQGQAQRAGLWALKTEQLETRQVSFSVGLDGVIPQVGNIINVSDELFAGRANGGRVSAVSEKQYVVTLDRDVTANLGDVLVVNGSHGKSEKRTIKAINGRKVTVNAPFEYAEREHVWAIEFDDLKLMRFRVMSITESEEGHSFAITAIQHEPQKYDAIDYGADVKQTTIKVVSPNIISVPSNVSLSARHRIVQTQSVATLIIQWTQVKDAVSYDVEWKKDDGTWIKLPRTSNTSVEIDGVYSGDYIARVRAVSAFDVQSKPTASQLTPIEGKAGKPPKLSKLTATGILFGMRLDWAFAQGSGDADYVEIQVASAPDINVIKLSNYSYPTNTATINGLQGDLTQYYRARVVDKLGFKSDWSDWASGTTDSSADKVLDLLNGKITESQLHHDLTSQIDKIDINEKKISATNKRLTTAVNDTTKSITEEIKQRQASFKKLSDGLTQEINKRTSDVENIYTTINSYKSSTDSSISVAQESIDLLVTDTTAISTKLDGVYAQVNPLMAGDGNELIGDGIFVGVWSETSARIEGDVALGEKIDNVSAKFGDNLAYVREQTKTIVNKQSSLATQVKVIAAAQSGNLSLIMDEYYTKTDTDSAISKGLKTFKADYVTPELNKKASAQALEDTQTNVSNISSKLEVTSTKLDGVYAQVNPLMAGDGKELLGDTIKVGVWTEQSARIEGDTALSTRIDVVSSQFNESSAKAFNKIHTLATDSTAQAQSIKTIETTVDGHTASIQAQSSSIDGLNAQYTVKVDVNGRVSGFGLASSSKSSDFAIRADKFYIAPPSGSGKGQSPFVVLTKSQKINGTTVAAGTYIKSAYIQNGSIDNLKIKDGAITRAKISNASIDRAKIADGAITNAKIENGAITRAKIGTAQVDTLQIAGQAVIVPRVQFSASPFEFYTIDKEEEINRLTIDAKGGGISISFGFESLEAISASDREQERGRVVVRIKRDNKALRILTFQAAQYLAYVDYRTGEHYGYKVSERYINLPTFLDTPPSGKHTYTVTLESRALNRGLNRNDRARHPVIIKGRSFHLIGAKR